MTRLFTILQAILVLSSGALNTATLQAQDREPAIVVPGPHANTGGDLAAGAAEDTLDACRARIPNDASIGQVMIAEQSCWRDENERKPIQAVPGARKTSGTYRRQ